MLRYFTVLDPLLVLCLGVAWFFPTIGGRFFARIETVGTRFAARKRLAILAIALAVIVGRVNMGVIDPVPVPQVHDEFAHLLAGDTFAHGRLTNPTPALPIFFETFHVNMRPTYMSKYPPGQGAVLAIGELLGSPWIGVPLSVAAMCAAVLWMLQGWVPARWALLGAVLVWLRFGFFHYWIDSYWGGAVAATGGALVMGALPRMMRRQKMWDAAVMGVGAFILANSRAFEGFLLCVTVGVILLVWLLGRRSVAWRVKLTRVIAPLVVVLTLGGAFIAYDNWRVTDNALLLPEALNHQAYMSAPVFLWEKPVERHYSNPQFEAFYHESNLQVWEQSFGNGAGGFAESLGLEGASALWFYVWPVLCVPLLAVPWLLGDRKIRMVGAQVAFCLAGSLTVVWFWPHYVAPLTASIFLLVIEAMRHLRLCKVGGRPVGVGLARVVVVFAVLTVPHHAVQAIRKPSTLSLFNSPVQQRARIEAELEAVPGEQLVIVRYSEKHSPHEEWVYNAADIEHAKVVWAREIPGVDVGPLLEHFRKRRVWLVEPDRQPAALVPYYEGERKAASD